MSIPDMPIAASPIILITVLPELLLERIRRPRLKKLMAHTVSEQVGVDAAPEASLTRRVFDDLAPAGGPPRW